MQPRGKAKTMIDFIMRARGKGNIEIERGLRVKLILKGIHPEKYSSESVDDPETLMRIRSAALDLGVQLP